MVEEDKDAKIDKKFDTMPDMMSCLLGKMEQKINNNLHQCYAAQHSGNNENIRNVEGERFVHRPTRGPASRPLYVTFTPREEQPQVVVSSFLGDEARQSYLEYNALPMDLKDQWTFDQFMNEKIRRNAGRNDHYTPPRNDYQQTLGKITMPYFDGSNKCTSRSWLQNINNYLSLRSMPKEDAIRFATLHLEGGAHAWWYHGLITLGYNLITTYDEFTDNMTERFYVKEPKVSLHELAQLKQHGSLEAYVTDFQQL